MDFATIQSKEYADALLKQGKPELIDQEPIGTGPFELVQYQRDSTIRYRAVRRLLGTEAEAGFAGVLDQQGSRGAAGQAARQRVPGHGVPQSGRPAGDQGGCGAAADGATGAEHRLSRVQQPEAAVHRQARAHRHQHGDRQAGDPAGGVSGRRPAGEESDPADHVVVQQPDPGFPARSRTRRRSCWPRPVSPTVSRPTSGRCRCSGRTIPTHAASPS